MYMCVCVSLAHHNFEGISPFIVLGIRQGIFFWHQGMPNLPWGTGSAPVIHWHMPHHALHRFRRGHGTWSCWEAVNFFNSFLHRRSECFSATAKQYVCVCVSVYTYYIPSIYSHAIAIIYIYISISPFIDDFCLWHDLLRQFNLACRSATSECTALRSFWQVLGAERNVRNLKWMVF